MTPPVQGRSLLYRQLRAGAVLLLFLGAVGAAGLGVYRMTVLNPTLDGERYHTFETVELADEPVYLEHTFVLTNHQRRPIEIEQVTSSCGCTTAEPSTRKVAPGASVEIATTLRLNHEGIKKSHVNITYGGTSLDTLYLQGSARLAHRLRAFPVASSEPGQPSELLILYIDYDTNDPPPAPELAPPPGVGAEFAEWERIEPVRPSVGTPARWRGRVRITLPEGDAAIDVPLVVRVKDFSAAAALVAPAAPMPAPQ
jgi:hypothetical protein